MDTKEFLVHLVNQIVDNPEEVKVTEVKGQKTTVYELRINISDFGRVIGKKGYTVQAIRILLRAVGRKHGTHTMLEIVE